MFSKHSRLAVVTIQICCVSMGFWSYAMSTSVPQTIGTTGCDSDYLEHDDVSLTGQPKIGIREVKQVPREPWPSGANFATEIANRGSPVVLTSTQYFKSLPAAEKWTVPYLVQNIPGRIVENAKRYPAKDGAPMYASGMPMKSIPEIMSTYHPHFSRHNVSTVEFFRHTGMLNELSPGIQLNRVDDSTADGWLQPDVPGGAVPVLSYSGYLRAWGEDFVRDLVLEGLVPTQDDDGPSEIKPYVWMGQKGVTTPCHYDYYNNFYVQLRGTKKFTILPPDIFESMHLYPAIHPAHRSSQLNFSAALEIDPNADPTSIAWEVELRRGEILFFPAMWFHQVETVSKFALSVNVWSEHRPLNQMLGAMDVALPFVAELMETHQDEFVNDPNADMKTQITRAYVSMVLARCRAGFLDSRLNTSANEEKIAVQFLKHHLLDQRYAKYKATLIVTEVDATLSRRPVAFSSSTMISRWPRFCHDNNLLQEFIRKNDGYDLHHFMATIDEVMSILEPAMSFLDEHRFNILLLNWVEWVVSSSFGPKYAAQAIWDMAHC